MKGSNILILTALISAMLAPQSALALRIPMGMVNTGDPNAMKGQRLQNPLGEDLGRIVDVTIDADGQPAFIILSVMGDKLVAIPYSAMLPSSARDRFVANITRDQVRNTPGLSPNARNLLSSLR